MSCSDIRLSLLQQTHWTMMEKHAQLLTVDRQMLLEFSKQLFTSVSVEGLVQGNITVEVC
jgi:secreted Zn-dependent insulinase-like peptidase